MAKAKKHTLSLSSGFILTLFAVSFITNFILIALIGQLVASQRHLHVRKQIHSNQILRLQTQIDRLQNPSDNY